MKLIKILLAVALLSLPAGAASELRTAIMTVTNGTTNGSFMTVNGSFRFATNALTANTFLTNASANWATTNIFNQFAAWPVFGILRSNLNSNVISFRGVDLTMSVSNFATLTWYTNTLGSNEWNHMHPYDNFPLGRRQTNASDDVYGISTYATNAFTESTNGPFRNYSTLTHTQSLMNKFFTGSYWNGGVISNAALANVTGSLVDIYATNVVVHTLTATNLSAPGAGDGSQKIGTGANASGLRSIAIGDATAAAYDYDIAIGYSASLSGTNAISIGRENIVTDAYGHVAVGQGISAGGAHSVSIGNQIVNAYNYSVGLGYQSEPTEDHQIRLGTSADHVSIPGDLRDSILTNATLKGVNNFDGEVQLTPRTHSAVISGYASAINLGTNAYVRVTGASGAFTNASFKGGYSGLEVLVEVVNPGLSCAILHRSSIGAPASTEQVNTGTGGLINMTNNPALFRVVHNGTEWVLGWHSN